jgi:class 3 adenylate cyclase/tetratricopeptide (TPR) repeat protein
MLNCPSCGEENPTKFRLCGYCGTALVSAAPAPLPAHEVRKTVTIVFSDLKESTALGERIDTEALHEVKERYFAAMAAEIVRHGGKIEKYIGDAIMAVFGLPRAHEDDALRAVRAALGMRSALQALNQGLLQRYGVALANRTGVNTGEVVATDDPGANQKLATGDAVNVAARLEQAAPVGEIYLGAATWHLVRDAVVAEPVAALALKGKALPVAAFRLVSAAGLDGNLRHLDTPLVGRDGELALLAEAWAAACSQRTVRLVTVVGDAGVGKSRLVHEAVARLGASARVLRGRCLAYGDGITFWPLVDMVGSAAGIEAGNPPDAALSRLQALVGDADVAARLASAIGLSGVAFPLNELYWAARRFLQGLAVVQPVVALIDDIHWAEPAFLDLLLHVLDAATDAPILLLATARHELLEEHPHWAERPSATRLMLDRLSDEAAEKVVEHLPGGALLAPELVERILAAAEGNPLYVEQMLSMLIDSHAVQPGGELDNLSGSTCADIAVPPTIHALLEARLDRLGREERATVEPAAVIGIEFEQPAVEALAPASLSASVAQHLGALSDKQFIERAPSGDAAGEYRFHHHLVRDTVYNGLLKRARAGLHIAFVGWLDRVNAERGRTLAYEEILGYHLEQAHRYLGELGPLDDQGLAIGRDAAARLSTAGKRALARGDMHAAANLFQRATALLPPDDLQRAELLPELGETLMGLGDFAGARAVLAEATSAAERLAIPRIKAASQIVGMFVRQFSAEPGDWSEQTLRTAHGLIAQLASESAHNELAMTWRLIVVVHGIAGRYSLANEAVEQSSVHARLAGNTRLLARNGALLSLNALLGPTPVAQAIVQCESLIADGLGNRRIECSILCKLAQLKAMNGELEAARELYRRARATLRDLGQGVFTAATGIDLASVELLGGDLAIAEREVRADYEFLAGMGETYYLSTLAALLSRVVRDQGRDDEALDISKIAEAATATDDVDSQALWRSIRAPIIARTGNIPLAESLARTALEFVRKTEAPVLQADTLSELASVLRLAGKTGQARQVIGEAIALYAAKGNLVAAAQARTWASKLDSD